MTSFKSLNNNESTAETDIFRSGIFTTVIQKLSKGIKKILCSSTRDSNKLQHALTEIILKKEKNQVEQFISCTSPPEIEKHPACLPPNSLLHSQFQ